MDTTISMERGNRIDFSGALKESAASGSDSSLSSVQMEDYLLPAGLPAVCLTLSEFGCLI